MNTDHDRLGTEEIRDAMTVPLAILGFVLTSLMLWVATRDPFMFLHRSA